MTDNTTDNLDASRLVTVAERPTEIAAAIVVAVLQDAGIRAVATGGFTAGFRAEAPGWVRVQAMESDAERAREVIAELKMERPENWEEEANDPDPS